MKARWATTAPFLLAVGSSVIARQRAADEDEMSACYFSCTWQVCVLFYTEIELERNSRKLIRLLEKAGWRLVEVSGDHHQFRHPAMPGRVTVPHPNKDIPPGTVASIYRQAGLRKRDK